MVHCVSQFTGILRTYNFWRKETDLTLQVTEYVSVPFSEDQLQKQGEAETKHSEKAQVSGHKNLPV